MKELVKTACNPALTKVVCQVAEEGNETRRLELEECGRKYWQIYVNWAEILRDQTEVPLVKELRKYLALKSFKNIRFNI